MPLLDHFHAPLFPERRWESLHAVWATAILELLNESVLPKGYFAEAQVHVGSRVEVDIGTFELSKRPDRPLRQEEGGLAVAEPEVWVAPPPSLSMPTIFPDSVEALVYSDLGGPILVGAIELISPGNKDRDEARTAFAAKCATYLHEGVGLVIIDIVTSRRSNLHNDLVALLGDDGRCEIGPEYDLYACSYGPVRTEKSERLDIWTSRLAVGERLPVLPLNLTPRLCVPVDLDKTYHDACRRSRLI